MAPVQPSASVAATGLGLRYIGSGEYQHAYGYSGEIVLNNSTASQFEFTTGSGYVVAEYNCVFELFNMNPNKMIGFKIWLNDIETIFNYVYFSSVGGGILDMDNKWPLLFPPFTKVKIEATTQNDSNIPSWGWLVGRVYGTE